MSRIVIPTGMAPCTVDIMRVTDTEVVLGDTSIGMSITNAAEHVVKEIDKQYPNRKIFYFDTDNNFDELVHTKGIFSHFKPGP